MKLARFLMVLLLPSIIYAQQGWELRINGLPGNTTLSEVSMVDPQNIWIAGSEGGWKTNDAGKNWIAVSPLPVGSGLVFALAARNPLNALVATTKGEIFKSSDGGLNWTKVFHNPAVTNFFNDLGMLDDSTGYAMGDAPNDTSQPGLVRTSNGGRTWTAVNNNLPLGGVQYDGRTYFINPQVGWTYIANQGLYKTTDGGTTWNQMLPAIPGFSTLFFVNDSLGFHTKIASTSAEVYKTKDGGKTWQKTLSTPGTLNELIYFVRCAPGGERIWAGGIEVYISDDMGETWTLQISRQNIPSCSSFPGQLENAAFIDDDVGVMVGDCAVFYTTTGGLLTSVDEPQSTPVSFALKQNYPNPLSALTTIQFELPARTHVTLKIFDVLGQEIATLIDDERPAGKHEAKWNVRQLPNGVYFYQLQAGELTSVKKLVLLR